MIFRRTKRAHLEAVARRRVEQFVGDAPSGLEVSIAAEPRRDELFFAYVTAFKRRGYDLQTVDRSTPDTWTVTFVRRSEP